ncbi:hypothetical protein PF010_g30667, partial [Phytophthora fragariae]
PAAEKNAGNAKGGKKEQLSKEEKQKGGKKGKK